MGINWNRRNFERQPAAARCTRDPQTWMEIGWWRGISVIDIYPPMKFKICNTFQMTENLFKCVDCGCMRTTRIFRFDSVCFFPHFSLCVCFHSIFTLNKPAQSQHESENVTHLNFHSYIMTLKLYFWNLLSGCGSLLFDRRRSSSTLTSSQISLKKNAHFIRFASFCTTLCAPAAAAAVWCESRCWTIISFHINKV